MLYYLILIGIVLACQSYCKKKVASKCDRYTELKPKADRTDTYYGLARKKKFYADTKTENYSALTIASWVLSTAKICNFLCSGKQTDMHCFLVLSSVRFTVYSILENNKSREVFIHASKSSHCEIVSSFDSVEQHNNDMFCMSSHK